MHYLYKQKVVKSDRRVALGLEHVISKLITYQYNSKVNL